MTAPIPQCEPSFDEHEAAALARYMGSGGWVTEFRETRAFEERIAEIVGVEHCVATNSGTVSLVLALLAAGVGPGDEVVVPDFSMIATANAARLLGARPVFVDVEPETLCMDLRQASAAFTTRTRALIHVSFNGRSNDLAALATACEAAGVVLVEDAAQSLASRHDGAHLGSFGALGCFSFSTPKIVTTGQGGAVVTADADLAARLRRLKDFGRAHGGNDIHDEVGFNFKFTDLQAVIGIEQLRKLPRRAARKRAIFARYRDALADLDALEWIDTDLEQTVPWFVDVFVDEPDDLAAHLQGEGIGSRRIYPPIHSQRAYDLDGSFPVTERFAARGLWLPSSVALPDADVDRVCSAVRAFYTR